VEGHSARCAERGFERNDDSSPVDITEFRPEPSALKPGSEGLVAGLLLRALAKGPTLREKHGRVGHPD
jgi:hypothetical protein